MENLENEKSALLKKHEEKIAELKKEAQNKLEKEKENFAKIFPRKIYVFLNNFL